MFSAAIFYYSKGRNPSKSHFNNGLNPILFLSFPAVWKALLKGGKDEGKKVQNPIKLISLMLLLSSRLTTFRSLFPFAFFVSSFLMICKSNFSIFFCDFLSGTSGKQQKKNFTSSSVYFEYFLFSGKNILIHKLFENSLQFLSIFHLPSQAYKGHGKVAAQWGSISDGNELKLLIEIFRKPFYCNAVAM